MAWRIDEAVIRGVIDNTVEGRTTGRIWLCGRDEPMELDLDGDCLRDLAGTRLAFSNPEPRAQDGLEVLQSMQKGLVGDMTASMRRRANDHDESGPDNEWHNVLSLEWFSEQNGRVLIETDRFALEISAPEWNMDEDAEAAQRLANLQAMRDFMGQVINRRETEEEDEPEPSELDEFAWEERLKESDRLTDAYQEVLEKFIDDPESERKEAFVMGWDGLLEAMADREEGRDENAELGIFDEDDEDEDDEDWWDEESGDEDREGHPLQARAQELALRAMDLVEREAKPGSPAYLLVSNLLQVSGKLAAALHGRGSGYEPETGYVLAILKRCLNWLNEAVGACQELMAHESDPDQRAALAHLRSSAFEIRDGITELRRELKS